MNLVVSAAPCGRNTPGIRLREGGSHFWVTKCASPSACIVCTCTKYTSVIAHSGFRKCYSRLARAAPIVISLSCRFLLNLFWVCICARGYPIASIYPMLWTVTLPREYWKKDNYKKVVHREFRVLKMQFFATFFTFEIPSTIQYTHFIKLLSLSVPKLKQYYF